MARSASSLGSPGVRGVTRCSLSGSESESKSRGRKGGRTVQADSVPEDAQDWQHHAERRHLPAGRPAQPEGHAVGGGEESRRPHLRLPEPVSRRGPRGAGGGPAPAVPRHRAARRLQRPQDRGAPGGIARQSMVLRALASFQDPFPPYAIASLGVA